LPQLAEIPRFLKFAELFRGDLSDSTRYGRKLLVVEACASGIDGVKK
jgi:hypothetical protein